ncbi:MAG TPA: hypothetical protein PL045_06855, partial [Chitinophagaceae bacterium]|nr:hypothetical protein [Chitinophagaceae bacterium]
MQKFFAITFFLSLQYLVAAQQKDSALIKALIDDIAASQVKTGGEFYAGMFPTFRECGGAPHNYQPDNNIFFTAITAFGLRNMLPYLNEEQRQQATSIIEKIVAVYPKYQNQFGDPFYNFWPTGKPIMPHTYFFKWLKGVFGQGDDADDTVMILMTGNSSDSIIKVVKQRMLRVANLATENRKIKSTYKEYRNIPAHSTYLGLRMPPDFDFAVQCNLLYFMFDKKLLLVKQDSATIELLAAMVKNREYMTAPAYISPYYVTSPILLYHLTRLMAAFKIPALEMYKPQVAKDIHALLENKTNIMDQIILRTSLLRLGEPAPALDIKSIKEFEESNQEQFIFFQARAAFSYPSPFKQIFLHFSYINYYFYCPVYNK